MSTYGTTTADVGSRPLVSICIPTYNAAGTIGDALGSVVKQSYRDLAIFVVDNASTDGTLAIVERFRDPRVIIQRNERNVGGYGNFDRCLIVAKGRYTALFHADDIYERDIVEKEVAFLEREPQAVAVFTEATRIDELGRKVGETRIPPELGSATRLHSFPEVLRALVRHGNFLVCPSAMVRTEEYRRRVGHWRAELFPVSADLDAWLRLLERSPIGILPERLVQYRISPGQWSEQSRRTIRRADSFRVIDSYLGKDRNAGLLSAEDLQWYAWLDRRDRVGRALNLVAAGRLAEAGGLCHDVPSWDAIVAAAHSRSGALTLGIGSIVTLLAGVGARELARGSVTQVMRLLRR